MRNHDPAISCDTTPLQHGPNRHIIHNMSTSLTNLTGQLLIAMPGMEDPRFEHGVVYLCAHSGDGAMGLIVNKPTPEINSADLLAQLDIATGDNAQDIMIHFGGPVETTRGFVLHSAEYEVSEGTVKVDDQINLTATLDVLSDLAHGQGPAQSLLALGYSGWGAGQLEGEIGQNGWLMAPATPDLVFGSENNTKWTKALQSIGIDPMLLSADAGRA